MSPDDLRRQLQSFVGVRKKVRLTRSMPNEPSHNGFVLGVGAEWVHLQQLHDFYIEGSTAVRIEHITEIRSGEYERHWERMLTAEGILDALPSGFSLPLDSTRELLRCLQKRGENVIVECEDDVEPIEDFYIGRILSVDRFHLQFANFDGLGHWDEEPHSILLTDVSKVQVDSPYCRIFSRYVDGVCPHSSRVP